MQRARYGCSYTCEEVKAVHAVFKTLLRGGDATALIRSATLRQTLTRFAVWAIKAELEPPRPPVLSKEERVAKAKARKKRANAKWNAKAKAKRALRREERFVTKLPHAARRPIPYAFTEHEKWTILGYRKIIPNRWLANYFGVQEQSLHRIVKGWVKELQKQSVAAEDCIPCAAE